MLQRVGQERGQTQFVLACAGGPEELHRGPYLLLRPVVRNIGAFVLLGRLGLFPVPYLLGRGQALLSQLGEMRFQVTAGYGERSAGLVLQPRVPVGEGVTVVLEAGMGSRALPF